MAPYLKPRSSVTQGYIATCLSLRFFAERVSAISLFQSDAPHRVIEPSFSRNDRNRSSKLHFGIRRWNAIRRNNKDCALQHFVAISRLAPSLIPSLNDNFQ